MLSAGAIPRLVLLLTLARATAADYADYVEYVKQLSQNETFVRMFDEHVKLYQDDSKGLKAIAPFTCNGTYVQGRAKATSVHQLRPTDINVVGALGDSITAGTGITASTVIGLLRQDRGLSWSVGGDASIATEETLPNMLKVFNPEVVGYSTGWGPVWIESVSRFNLADPGDKSEAIPGQAKALVQRMTADSKVNFVEDWKLITIFVGGNDLCFFCTNKKAYGAEQYVANLQAALDILHQKVPRAFVNVVQILDIAIVRRLNANLVCDTLHLVGCPCAAYPWNSEAEKELIAETERYRKLTRELIESGRYDTREDFTVVEQPFFTETDPPNKEDGEPDLSYFSADCFHLSLKGHRAAAEALWNNMVEPVGKKRTKWSPGEIVECPGTQAPYFFTRKNSGVMNSGPLGETSNQYLAGPVFDPEVDGPSPDTPPSGKSFIMTTMYASVVAVAMAVVVVLGVLAWKRRSRQHEEHAKLLDTRGYTI